MDNNQWNPDEWQGRTKEQVEKNNKMFGYVMLFGIFMFFISIIIYSLKLLKFI